VCDKFRMTEYFSAAFLIPKIPLIP
jgi:hypothetical protein